MLAPPSLTDVPAARSGWPDRPVTVTCVPCCCHVPFQPDRACRPPSRSKPRIHRFMSVLLVLAIDIDTVAPFAQVSFTWYATLHDDDALAPAAADPASPTDALDPTDAPDPTGHLAAPESPERAGPTAAAATTTPTKAAAAPPAIAIFTDVRV